MNHFYFLLGIIILAYGSECFARDNRGLIRESVRGHVQQIRLEETSTRSDRRQQYLRECRRYHELFNRNSTPVNPECETNGAPTEGDATRPAYGFFSFVGHLFRPNQFSCNDLLYLNGEGESVTSQDICACHQCSGGFKVFLQKGLEIFNRDERVLKEFMQELIGELWQDQLSAHFDRMIYFDLLQEQGIIPNDFLVGVRECRLGAVYDTKERRFNLDNGILGSLFNVSQNSSLSRGNQSQCNQNIFKQRLPYLLGQEPRRRFNPEQAILSYGENFVRVARLTDGNLIPSQGFGLPSMTNACLPPRGFRRMNLPALGSAQFNSLFYNEAPNPTGQGVDRTRAISSGREFFHDLHFRNSLQGLTYEEYLTRMDFTEQFAGDGERRQSALTSQGFQEYQATSELMRQTLAQDPLFLLIQGMNDEQLKMNLTNDFLTSSHRGIFDNTINRKVIQEALNDSCKELGGGQALQQYLCRDEMPQFSPSFLSAHVIPKLIARFGTARGERMARLLSRNTLCDEDRQGFNTYTAREQSDPDKKLESLLNPDKVVNSNLRGQLSERQRHIPAQSSPASVTSRASRESRTPYEITNTALCGRIFPEGCRLEEGQASSSTNSCGTPETWRSSLQTEGVPLFLGLIESYPSPSHNEDDTNIKRLQRFLRDHGVRSPPGDEARLRELASAKISALILEDPQALIRYTLRSDSQQDNAQTAQAFLSLSNFLNNPQISPPDPSDSSTSAGSAVASTPPPPEQALFSSVVRSDGDAASGVDSLSPPAQGNYMIFANTTDQTALDTYAATVASQPATAGGPDATTTSSTTTSTTQVIPYGARDPFYVPPPPTTETIASFVETKATSEVIPIAATGTGAGTSTVNEGGVTDTKSAGTESSGAASGTSDYANSSYGTNDSTASLSGSLTERGIGTPSSLPGTPERTPTRRTTPTTNPTNPSDDPYIQQLQAERDEMTRLLRDYDDTIERFSNAPVTNPAVRRTPPNPIFTNPNLASDEELFRDPRNPRSPGTLPVDYTPTSDDDPINGARNETLGSYIQRIPDSAPKIASTTDNDYSGVPNTASVGGVGGGAVSDVGGRAPASIGQAAGAGAGGISSIKDSLRRGKNIAKEKDKELDPLEDFEEFLGLPAIKYENRHFTYELNLILPYELFGSFETSDIVKTLGLEGMFFTAAQNTGAGVVLYVFGFNPEDLPWENFQTKDEVLRLMKLKNIIGTLKSMEDPKANDELAEIAAHTKVIARFDASAADLTKMRGKFISKTQYQALIAKLGYLKANP